MVFMKVTQHAILDILKTLKLLNFWSRSHCISNSITSTIKKESYLQQVGKAIYPMKAYGMKIIKK